MEYKKVTPLPISYVQIANHLKLFSLSFVNNDELIACVS